MASEGEVAGFDWRQDSLWRRLPLTLPGALLISLLSLWLGGGFLLGTVHTPSPPDKISLDAELIELPPPPEVKEKPRRLLRRKDAPQPNPEPPPVIAPASLAAPPAPSAEEWQLASSYTLKNSKRYRNAWGQQVRSMMGTAVEGPDQGQVRLRVTINPDGSLAQVEELWSTSAKASELAMKAIRNMPKLPPTPTGKPLVFEKTISFLPYETGWPPSYKNDCLPDPPQFKNPFAWDGRSPQLPSVQQSYPTAGAETPAGDCPTDSTADSIEEEELELKRQMERNRWGR